MSELGIENVKIKEKKNKKEKIKIKTYDKSRIYINGTIIALIVLTVIGFLTFDYKGVNLMEALGQTMENVKLMFLSPELTHFSFIQGLGKVLTTISLAFLTTLIGSIIALFLSIFAASNLSSKRTCAFIKGFVALIRAIPTVLWVLIFAVVLGLGAEAAVIGMTFHTVGYLIKAYSEAFEELDNGVIEAIRGCGGNFFQIVFGAVIPSSIRYIVAWTFLRFEINFTNAVAMGAAAGAGGIGFELFMSSNFYFNVQEVGFIAIMILVVAMILEFSSTEIKKRYI
ncbi:MAG: ABC transporter permease subunit [Sarcina sp.]|uniref:ABC transporter permease subunit n=1 Tax=Clostridium sp. TaxID=1506 RepID=UPI003F32467D